ncbi:hypothetical protein TNCV_3701641 [Trichonephila clavipes]|nr:hypothetical protein TNCV_3701641 [Trichonephila clavipes]
MPSAENAIFAIKLFAFPAKIPITEPVLPYILEEWISKNIPAQKELISNFGRRDANEFADAGQMSCIKTEKTNTKTFYREELTELACVFEDARKSENVEQLITDRGS